MIPVTYTRYYDKEDRLVGHEYVGEDGTVYEKLETQYGVDGNEIYDYAL